MKEKLIAVLLLFCLFSCIQDDDQSGDEPISDFQAVIMQRAAFENSIELQDPKPIEETGKIYVKGTELYINEPYKGFHIIDNTDPTNPTPIKYLVTPGATDLIFKQDSFYINQAVDLVALKFDTGFNQVTETRRILGVFPSIRSPQGFQAYTEEGQIVVNWIEN
ncbi:MAG: hypothetical protein HRT68_08445 [Flavobacteriaceae bacterium]|nr:hypothetical protein [Flavobacteriaceae bacterium]